MILSQQRKKIRWPLDVAPILHAILDQEDEIDRNKEHFWCIGLNGRNVIQYIELASLGIVNRSLVHPREVYRFAIMKGVQSLIIAHNHPSGDTMPSQDDIAVTRQLYDAGKIIGIKLLDHIIISDDKSRPFYSMLEAGIVVS